MGIIPAIFYVIIGGSLSDTYGKRKPLILLPLLGAFITNMAYVLISLFGEALPLEIFFLTKAWDFCGGMPLYYLGVCSYAASNSKKTNRSTTLARLDGVEQTALILGVSLSPYAFSHWGYLGCFVFRVVGGLLAIFYLMMVCPEIEAKRKISSDSRDIILNHENGEVRAADKESYLKKYIVSPFIFALEVLRKPRESSTKRLVYLQIFNCTLYWFVMEEQNMLYFYMARRFDGFDGTDFALYTMTIKIAGIVGLLFVIPLLSKAAGLHESAIMLVLTTLTSVSLLSSAFPNSLYPAFYVTRLIGFLRPATMSLARSLLARSVDGVNEIGRIYAVTGFISAIVTVFSYPCYRFLYDSTATYFPQAILVMAGSLSSLTVVFNGFLYWQRDHIGTP